MELINVISDLVSNIGFPIACVCVMFYEVEQERKAHHEESCKWIDALNRNTSIIEKLYDKLSE